MGSGANWMDTYGDMVTLLLAFFVLLFAFSTVDGEKFDALAGSLRGTGLNIIPYLDLQTVVNRPISLEINSAASDLMDSDGDPAAVDDPEDPQPQTEGNITQDLANFNAIVLALQSFINDNDIAADLYPQKETLTVILRVKDHIFFDSGDAAIKPGAYKIIDGLAELFAANMDVIDVIKVEGHTDTDPIHTPVYNDNWDLSTKRATNAVRRILLNAGVDHAKLIPIGMSEYHPIASNETAEGKAQNRRVDFIIQSIMSEE